MMDEIDTDSLVISDAFLGMRLDKILASHYSNIRSRTYFQNLIEEKRVLVNDATVKKRYLPKVGDEISIFFIANPELDLQPEPIPLDIIYEDEFLIAINKPAGLVVHPAPGNWTGTFVNALLYHCSTLNVSLTNCVNHSLRPGIVHRLDKDTSGVLLAAKTPLAQQKLIELFANRQMHKEYLAICLGNPGDVEINAPIGRHPIDRKRMTVVEVEGKGKPALSVCRTLQANERLSLVNIDLKTGRTHQIRVHLKYKGTPVLGDDLYGNISQNKHYGVKRQMLHAQLLSFVHPITNKSISIKASLPNDFETCLISNKFHLENLL